jgi:multidrug resistance protein, MATE family
MLPIFDGAFTSWKMYLKLGIPGAVMSVAEFWIFEVMTVFSAYAGNTSLAAMSVLNNIVAICFSVSAGISMALTSLVGRLLGEEKIEMAQKSTIVGFALFLMYITFIILLLSLFPTHFVHLFTDQDDIVGEFTTLCIIAINFMMFFDSLGALL